MGIFLGQNSFSWLINATSILGTVNQSNAVTDFTSFPRSDSGSPFINLFKKLEASLTESARGFGFNKVINIFLVGSSR